MNQLYAAVGEVSQRVPPALHLALKALLVGVVCHLSIQVGHQFKFPPHDISALWPTSAILVSILVASPARHWWVYLLAGYSTYAIDVARFGFLASDVLYNLADIIKVLIAAVGVRWLAGGLRAFDSLRGLVLYISAAVVLAPATSAFVAALAGAGEGYWFYWRAWCMSEALAFLVLAPAILTWISAARAAPRGVSFARCLEAGLLACGLIAISLVVFHGPSAAEGSIPVLVYLPLPFLLWAAVRFGPVGVNTGLLAVAFLAISGVLQGRGPFGTSVPEGNVFPLQLFLIMLSLPLMFLAALVAERRERTNVLRESEARFRSMADTAPVLVWMSGKDKLWSFFNKTWLDFTGRTLDKELGNGWSEGIHPEDLARCSAIQVDAFDARRSFTMEYRLRRHDGEYRWILDNGAPRIAPDGTFVGYIGCAHDITERKVAELAAQRHRNAIGQALAFERLVAELSAGFISLAATHIDEYIDAALRQIVETLGVERATLIEFLPDAGVVRFTHSWAVDGVAPVPSSVPADVVPWARARMEAALPAVVDRMSELPPEGSVDKVFWQQLGIKSFIAWPLQASGKLAGSLSVSCVRHERAWSQTDRDRVQSLASIFGNAVARKRAMEDVERALRFERLLADLSSSLLREPLSDPRETVRRALRAIGESLHVEPVALWRLSVESDRLELEYSWPAEAAEVTPQFLSRTELPWMLDRLLLGNTVSFSRSEKLPEEARIDEQTLDRRGVRSLLLVPVMVEGATSGALSLAAVDLVRSWPEDLLPRMRLLGEMFAAMLARARASKRLQEARVEAGQYRERLAHLVRVHTVGEMSTSIAHEINQPLVAIENYALAARRWLTSSGAIDTKTVDELLDKIARQAARAGDVLQRLRSMLKKHEPQMIELDLGRLVSETMKLVAIGGRWADSHVEVVVASGLPPVLADEIQIQQVVLNLARNAWEAMEDAGVGRPYLRLDVRHSGQSDLVVRVVDSGPGVPPQEADRIFEPFYSTKDSGLGMGLAICRAIVVAHGGTLSFVPSPHGGAVFQFTLPAADVGVAA
jgi:PAS domain S-box-containing protein